MEDSIKYVNIDDLIPGEFQAHFDNIGNNNNDLANSISKYGIIVPLIVREKGIQQYEIILGNRRYSAAKMIGLKQVPVIVVNVDDEKALDIIISDNIQRKELTAKEEAYLYDKDLEYTNNNEKSLSDKLGIPIDRIISKLKTIKKDYEKPEKSIENNNLNNIPSSNNSINQDIINLSELNKEEREDLNMNNDIINNQNLNTDPTKNPAQQPVQEPTFGGRFFPSLEDEPTNMNISQNISAFSMPNNTPQTQPLIDLTDTSTPNNDINQNNISYSSNNQLNNSNININPISNINNNINDIQQEQPAVPNLDALSSNIVDNQYQTVESINNENIQPVYNLNNTPRDISNNINIPAQNSVDYSLNSSPMESLNNLESNNQLPPTDINNNTSMNLNNNINQFSTNNIADNQNLSMNNNNIEQNQNIDIVNEALNYNNDNNIEANNETKDIIPVVNMIKSLAINIENLGYKLNISEEENNESYSINIEVEK